MTMARRGTPTSFGLEAEVGHPPAAAPAASGCFGPRAVEMKVTPRRGEPGSNVLIQKPLTGMTIRLTPELLGRLQTPGSKPGIQLVLRSMAEG